jgi:hypothetical protein
MEFSLVYLEVTYRDSTVGIVTGYGPECKGSIPGRGKIFLFSAPSTDHSPQISAKGQECWSYTSTPSPRLHGVKAHKHIPDQSQLTN